MLDRLVGREREREQLAELLDERHARLVTIAGPGGVGKTRFAEEMLALAPPSLRPAVMVGVAHTKSVEELVRAVASRLDLFEIDTAPSRERIGASLHARRARLLVLDNLEQVLPEAAPLLVEWLAAAPELRVWITSRRATGLRIEHLLELSPLPLVDAADLLEQRARAAGRSLDRADLERLATRLEGLPLALELAAGALSVLTPAELLAHHASGGAPLRAVDPTIDARHQTLARAIAWSLDLLAPAERRALLALAIFERAFTLELARDVIEGTEGTDALEVVRALRRDSLLVARPNGSVMHFHMLDVVRRHALAELRRDPAALERARDRHARTMATHGLRACEALRTPSSHEARAWLRDHADDLLSAHDHAVGSGKPRLPLALALDALFVVTGPARARATVLESALADDPDDRPALRHAARLALASARLAIGDGDGALRVTEEALAAATSPEVRSAVRAFELGLWRHRDRARAARMVEEETAEILASGSPATSARWLDEAGLLATERGDFASGIELLQRAAQHAATAGDRRFQLLVALDAADARLAQGDLDAAQLGFEAIVAEEHELVDALARSGAHTYLGVIALLRDDLAKARQHFDRGRQIAEEAAEPRAIANTRLNAAELEEDSGRIDLALEWYRDAERFYRSRRASSLVQRALACQARALARKQDHAGAREVLDGMLPGEERALTELVLDALAGHDRGRIAARLASLRPNSWEARLLVRGIDREAPVGERVVVDLGRQVVRSKDGVIDLSRRPVARRVLERLAAETARVPLPPEALIAAGWPGERMRASSATHRLHSLLHELRKLALGDGLVWNGEGYLLDPERVDVRRV